ncbi:MAG TPA: putative molybdenum carrier protein, partial [Candidatus Dojkabacteria bacterium]|nr:putative molybdenum carrier protein [Candidatus Dojkabacteria bacterium]
MQKYNVKVGDIVKQFGKSADGTTKTVLTRITAIHPKGNPEFLNTWEKEGWTAEGVEAIKRFKDGAAAIEFEVIKSNISINKDKWTKDSPKQSNKLFDSTDKELKKGSVVEYNGQKYLYWNTNKSGKAQLINTDGTKFSGTPNTNKLTVLGSYKTTIYNNVEYIVTDNNNIYSGATGNLVYTGKDNSSKSQRERIINKAKESLKSNIGVWSKNSTIEFQEEQSSGYIERTRKNASADATIDFGLNQTGESWTKKAVENNKKKYIGINTNNLTITTEMINNIVENLNSVNAKTLNIAGMGIYNMKNNTQEEIDKFVYDLLKKVVESPNLKTKIESIRTGGQTGFDEAGAKASQKLGIKTIVLAPKGWVFRNKEGKDISNKQAFENRFSQSNIVNYSKKENNEPLFSRSTNNISLVAAELFDSNPELANQIYETLGLTTINE